MNKTGKKLRRILALVLVFTALFTTTSFAAFSDDDLVSPTASAYLQTYNAFITPKGNGDIAISFTVTGTRQMTDIGVTDIYLYQYDGSSHSTAATFHNTDPSYGYLMASNQITHSGTVEFDGTKGYVYQAYVFVKAANSSGYDTAVHHTLEVTAT